MLHRAPDHVTRGGPSGRSRRRAGRGSGRARRRHQHLTATGQAAQPCGADDRHPDVVTLATDRPTLGHRLAQSARRRRARCDRRFRCKFSATSRRPPNTDHDTDGNDYRQQRNPALRKPPAKRRLGISCARRRLIAGIRRIAVRRSEAHQLRGSDIDPMTRLLPRPTRNTTANSHSTPRLTDRNHVVIASTGSTVAVRSTTSAVDAYASAHHPQHRRPHTGRDPALPRSRGAPKCAPSSRWCGAPVGAQPVELCGIVRRSLTCRAEWRVRQSGSSAWC